MSDFPDSANQFFCSTATGDDSNPGTFEQPVKTLYQATQLAVAAGGGDIHFGPETEVGGPVQYQGLWLRSDGVVVPGFINTGFAPLRYIGHAAESAFGFAPTGTARIIGGGGADTYDPHMPNIWLVGDYKEVPFRMYNVQSSVLPFYGYAAPLRVGWDYVRRNDGSEERIDITAGVRTGTSTTYTLDLTTATQYQALSGYRTGGVSVVNIQLPSNINCEPWNVGAPVRITSPTDPNFHSVDAVALAITNNSTAAINPGMVTTLNYADPGPDIGSAGAPVAITGMTVCSHGLQAKERVAVNINADFAGDFVPLCTVRLAAATVDTITIPDKWPYTGDTSQTGAIGSVVKQERARHQWSGVDFHECIFQGRPDGNDDPRFGPTCDLGATDAHCTRFFDCYLQGFTFPCGLDQTHIDADRRACGILCDPGASGQSGASVQVYRMQSSQANLRIYAGNSTGSVAYVDDWLQEGNANSPSNPIVMLMEASGFEWAYINRAFQADSTLNSSIYIGPGYDPLRVHIGIIDGQESLTPGAPIIDALSGYQGPANARSAFWQNFGANNIVPSPWEAGQIITWPGGITGHHAGVNRTMAALYARSPNLFPTLARWQDAAPFPSGVTVTQSFTNTDLLGPDGSVGVFKINNTNGTRQQIVIGSYPFTWSGQVGDRVFLGTWINSISGIVEVPSLYLGNYDMGVAYNGSNALVITPPLANTGWQWMYGAATITALTTGHYSIDIVIPPGVTYLYAPTLFKLDSNSANSTYVTNQDAWEFMANAKHQPIYLAPGMVGTMESQKLIGHGGLGTAARYTTGAGGQITLGSENGNAVEIFDEAGNSLGVLPLYGFTVNPPTAGLALWLRADAGVTTSGTSVSAWADQSGSGNDVTQASGSLQPTFNASSINGLPGITFSALKRLEGTTNPLASGSPRSIIVVAKSTSASGGVFIGIRESGPLFNAEIVNGGAVAGQCIFGSDDVSYWKTGIQTLPTDIVAEFYGTVGSPLLANVNGTAQSLTVGTGSGNIVSDTGSSGFTVGNLQLGIGSDLPWIGDICEILVYDHILSPSDLATAREYLSTKYGIAI